MKVKVLYRAVLPAQFLELRS